MLCIENLGTKMGWMRILSAGLVQMIAPLYHSITELDA